MKLWTRFTGLRRVFIAFSVTALLAGPTFALEIPGPQVKRNVDRVLKSIDWSSNLDSLRARAESERKLIFWVQLVGKLDGGL